MCAVLWPNVMVYFKAICAPCSFQLWWRCQSQAFALEALDTHLRNLVIVSILQPGSAALLGIHDVLAEHFLA